MMTTADEKKLEPEGEEKKRKKRGEGIMSWFIDCLQFLSRKKGEI